MSCAVKVFSVIFIVLLNDAMRCDSCSSEEPPDPGPTNRDVLKILNSVGETMKQYYKDLNAQSAYQSESIKTAIKPVIDDKTAKLVSEIAKNRKQIEKVVEIIEDQHRRTLRELTGIKGSIQSIIDIVVVDRQQSLISEKHIDEFIDELRSFTKRGESIEATYNKFLAFYKDPGKFNERSVYQFIDHCYGYNEFGMSQILNTMLNRLIGDRGVFYLMTQPMVETYVLATRYSSTLEYLSKLAHYLSALEVRCLMMVTGAKGMAHFLDPDDSYESEFESYKMLSLHRLKSLIETGQFFAKLYSGRLFIYDSEKNKDESDSRYYEFVHYTKEKTRDCVGTRKIYDKITYCLHCECYCNETFADRYISLDEIVTDLEGNRVLTGIRFNKRNGAIGLDVQESEFDEKGYILSGTSKWIINKAFNKFELHPNKREIHLAEISVDNDRTITGVRFYEVEDGVELQVRINDLITCGKKKTILSTSFKWVRANTEPETIFDLEKDNVGHPSVAELSGSVSIPTFNHARVKVSATSFEKDVAQAVVPFFDARQVLPIRPMLSRGVGLVYKRRTNEYGGFIAPYLIITDFSDHIDVDFLDIIAPQKRHITSIGTSISIIKQRWSFIVINCLILLLF